MHLQLAFTVVSATCALGSAINTRQMAFRFSPSATFQYNVGNGAIYSSDYVYVAKSPESKGNDNTTLLTVVYPEASRGKKCQLGLFSELIHAEGSKQLDLFTSLTPAPAGGASGWPPGNQRGTHLGRLSIVAEGLAPWVAKYSTYLTEATPCKPPGTVEGFELVGVGERDYVSFYPTRFRIYYFS
ncbi:hypothetical protein Cob_v002517 [Colletotrichum orbiculare MAFF 240422]|uniref:Uncharacterized protein n=1 Tax=Colletotrichum orbiculare (strain 104-T / ATCC 96160 / CBS 514.97 / LARS 414 / MAFF 240422) TaxID=1213857 RepID=N4VM92_COLOR|nr:hypothetical protein Cob_v002517 [Colletotrichum orbiculare MAFF 240422]